MRPSATVSVIVAVVLLGLGLFLPWWSGELQGGSYSIDLRGMEMCLNDACHTRALAGMDEGSQLWSKLGLGAFGASGMSILLLIASVAIARGGRSIANLSWVAAVMCLFSAALGTLFVLVRPEFEAVSPTFGIACCIAGGLVGALAVRVFATPAASKSQRSS